MCFGYNPCMVALTNITADFPQTALRGRAQNHRYRLGAEPCSKSNSQANLREATYDECKRLGSCSKDPIGYWGGPHGYSYADCQPLFLTDALGLLSIDPSAGRPTLRLNPPQYKHGIYHGVGAQMNITFRFSNDDFIDKNGCCLCDALGVYQSASGSVSYTDRSYKFSFDPDGGSPYPNVQFSPDGTNTTKARMVNPCIGPGGRGIFMAADDPWVPAWDPWAWFSRSRLMAFEFEATTCLACFDRIVVGGPGGAIGVNYQVKKKYACVRWGFTIFWNPFSRRYEGKSSSTTVQYQMNE
jgi:hypothetical protein